MASELCMNCFSVKGQYEVCPFCGYVEGTPPKQPHYLMPGTLLGNRFIVGTVIGVGGFGITYKCFDTTLGVTVAVKEFYPAGLVNRAPGERRVGLLSGDKEGQYQERLERFLMEAQSVAQFGKAKDIVNVFDFFEENGTAYIIMEYIDGVLLKDYLDRQGVIEPELAMNIIMLIIEAVKKIHSKGIIHRDISPDNIFITNENEIKVFDFGAAQLNDSREGMAAEPVIKVGYSPLEQYRDKSKQGYYTDVYAVGAILYQMLTGVKPIESTEREIKDELKSPREMGIKVGGNTDRAVMEALAVRPELRFQGIQQFQEALQNKRIAEYPKEKIRKRKRTRNWIIGTSVVAALAVGVGVGLYSTVLKPKNPIFDNTVKVGTQIVVWVENEDQKEQIDELVENGFRKGDSSSNDENIQKMWKEDEQVTVTVEVKEDMEVALDTAREDESISLPNMFLTDHVSNLEEYKLVSMKDNVYASLNTEDYLYLSEYPEKFSSMEEMPTGIDTLMLYACQIDYDKNNTLEEKSYFVENDSGDGIVEFSELISSEEMYAEDDNDKLNSRLAWFQEDARARILLLDNQSVWEKVILGKSFPTQEMIDYLSEIQSVSGTAQKKKYRINRKQGQELYGSNLVAGVGLRAQLNEARDSEEAKGANPLGSYRTYVVTKDDRILVDFSEKYAITRESDQSQQTACMRLLWVMLSEIGQKKKTAPGETTYPILKKMFVDFPSYNADFGEFVELVTANRDCVLIGSEAQAAQGFIEDLEGLASTEEIQEYCETYMAK